MEPIDPRIIAELAKRNDIFRHPVPENPFLRAAKLVSLICSLADEYNLVASELHGLGYNQFPTCYGLEGLVSIDGGGCCNFNLDWILSCIPEGPTPCCGGGAETIIKESSRAPKPKRDPASALLLRLGYEPEEFRCAYCQEAGGTVFGPDGRSWHVDHMYPRVHGGDDQADNKILACATCNNRKGSKTAVEFIRLIRDGRA